jgi:hypothetical protein
VEVYRGLVLGSRVVVSGREPPKQIGVCRDQSPTEAALSWRQAKQVPARCDCGSSTAAFNPLAEVAENPHRRGAGAADSGRQVAAVG